jgi:hypothetical protein
MTTLREAAQQALEALEYACGDRCNAEYNPCWQREVSETLKAALAEPEPQEIADLRQACQEGWRYADELDQERKRLEEALRAALAEPNRAQKLTEAGYTRRPTLRELAEGAEPVQEPTVTVYGIKGQV